MLQERTAATPEQSEPSTDRKSKRGRALIIGTLALSTLYAPALPFLASSGSRSGSSLVRTASAAPDDDAVPPQVEAAVDKALDWLAQNQKPDGTWPQGGGSTTAVPSLAVMAFLSRGHIPGQGKYGDLLYKSIDYVIASQKENGILSTSTNNAAMYEHGISTAMLSEVYGMVDDERRTKIDKVLSKAVKLILDAQAPGGNPKPMPHTGGWRYGPTAADSDISCTGWQLMALRGAANCGASVPKKALEDGVEYVKRNVVQTGGFAYQQNGPANQARTGTGIISMVMLGKHTADNPNPEAVKGGDFLLASPPDNPNIEFYFYAVYYCSQAFNQLGGKYWDEGYPKLRDALMKLQQPTGNWAGGVGQEAEVGDGYRTSMAVLALCVPYRYLPLYQR